MTLVAGAKAIAMLPDYFENADFKTYGTVLKSAENRKVHVYFLRLLIDELSKKLKLMGKNINVSYF